MPTGYTAPIEDNPNYSFNEFVLSCARAFGACISMLDTDQIQPPKAFESNLDYFNQLQEAETRLADIRRMSLEQAEVAADKEARRSNEERIKTLACLEERAARYKNMLEQVNAWQPPTEAHGSLKQFMIEQIHESIRLSCDVGTLEAYCRPTRTLSPAAWLARQEDCAKADVAYYAKRWAAEQARAAENSKWVQDLYRSLGL